MSQNCRYNLFWQDNLEDAQSEQAINSFMDFSSEAFSRNFNLGNSPNFLLDLSFERSILQILSEECILFSNNSSEEELNEKDIEELYFIKKIKKPNDLFIVKNENDTSKENSTQSNKELRGRKRKNFSIKYANKRPHDKNSLDNILRKIQVHYISFLILFLNAILKHLENNSQYPELKQKSSKPLKFCKLDYNFKKNVNKKAIELLKSKTIGDIIKNKISSKYSKTNDEVKNDYNKIICEKIKQTEYYEVINKILSENYLKFFEIYHQNKRNINLREYGMDEDIILPSNVKTFSDLLKTDKEKADKEYRKNIDECINNFFVNKKLFSLYRTIPNLP